MKIGNWVRALGRGLARQACRACIERCGIIAGSACCGETMAQWFDQAGTPT